MLNHEELKLPELVEKFMLHLEEKGYALSTRSRLWAYYRLLLKYAKKNNIQNYSLEVGKTFLLEHHSHHWVTTDKLSIAQNYLQRHITILSEFQTHGEIVSRKRMKRIYSISHFEDVIYGYLEYERSLGLKESTIASKKHCLNQLFEYWELAGIRSTKDISSESVYGFLESRTYFSVTTKECYQYILRDLIQYLHKHQVCKPELLKLFPIISLHSKNAYPSYFTPKDISQILRCVDTNTVTGKRDYLILLLAAQLGMRVSDICALKIDNINFRKRLIKYVQVKTGDSVNLPMTDELFYAMIDYLKDARPECNFNEVFVKKRAPAEPFRYRNFYVMLQKYLNAAEIKISNGQKHGLHSLRSSLASNMLRDGVSISVISNVLGHRYCDTTSSYLKIDIPGLRKAALEVPYDCN